MKTAKTLKRKPCNPKPFLSVVWDTDDRPSQVNVNPNLKWKNINWKRALKNVFKLQKLIYRASSRGKIRKMRKHQRLLTKSYYLRLLAVRGVTQDSQGRKTAGVDVIKSLSPMQRFNLVDILKTRHLKASLTLGVWIPKLGKDEKGPLGISMMYDTALQALVKLGMEPGWEAHFEPNSYGFIPGRSTHDAIGAIYKSISKKPEYVFDADLSKCFDRINHDAILGKIGRSPYRRLVKEWLKSGVLDNNQFHPPLLGVGTPRRRHPNKSATWVKEKYLPTVKTRNWVLNDGEYILSSHSDLPTVRPIKVKGNQLPYDDDWTYSSSCIGKHPGVRKEVTTLLKGQKNKYASCGLTFRPTDLRSVDHIKPRSEGGRYTIRNKQLLHRYCHDTKTALDEKRYPETKLQDLPEDYLWVDDILILRQGCTLELGRLREEPCEVKVSRTVLKTSRVG